MCSHVASSVALEHLCKERYVVSFKMITRLSTWIVLIFFIGYIQCVEQHTSYRSRNPKKCCQDKEILRLNGSTYYCDDDEFIVPLNLRDEYTVSFPTDCGDDFCLDKSAKGDIVELYCPEKVKSKNNVSVSVFYKCCPEGMSYDLSGKYCIFHDNGYSLSNFYKNESGLVDIELGMPVCKKTIVDILTTDDIQLGAEQFKVKDLLTNKLFSIRKGNFCVDKSVSGTDVVRTCENIDLCKDRVCIPKCCGSGELFAPQNDKHGCQKLWNDSTKLEYNYTSTKGFNFTLEQVIVIDTLHCPAGRYIFNKSDPYNFWPNGTLIQGKTVFEATGSIYCVENIKDFPETQIFACFADQDEIVETKFYFYFSGLVISCIFLMLTLLVYFFLPDLQNLHGKTVMCHVSSLLAAYICLSLVQRKTTYDDVQCKTFGYSIYFTFLAAFSWLNVMCFDIWWTFGMVRMPDIRKQKEIKRFLLYCLYAFGLPLVLTIITMIIEFTKSIPVDFQPRFGGQRCWFNLEKPYAHAIFFIAPIAVQILANCILFALTAYHCIKVKEEINKIADSNTHKKKTFLVNKETFIMNLKLSIIMGVVWIFEIVSTYIHEPKYLWYALDTINVLQGVWYFFIFVLKPKVWRSLKHKFGYNAIRESSLTQSTSVSGKNSINTAPQSRFSSNQKQDGKVNKNPLDRSPK